MLAAKNGSSAFVIIFKMVDNDRLLEEKLREAACIGDVEDVYNLISKGVNVNSSNDINGWTPLHWAAYRNHKETIILLLRHGADKRKLTHKGETAASLCKNKELQLFLGGPGSATENQQELPIIPNYLRHPPLLIEKAEKLELGMKHTVIPSCTNIEEIVLKVRIANCGDPDFIEIELLKTEMTFAKLVKTCCEELNTSPNQISKIRKLPNTILRKDKDVHRLTDYQELELVLSTPSTSSSNNVLLSSPITPTINGNGYESIFLRKNQTILY